VKEEFYILLSNALDVAERGLASTDGEQRDGLVHATEGRHIDGSPSVLARPLSATSRALLSALLRS
jgi:hypothetical protein